MKARALFFRFLCVWGLCSIPLIPIAEEPRTSAQTQPLDLVVTGLPFALEKNIRAHMSLAPYPATTELLAAQIEHLHYQAQQKGAQALIPFGYYQSKIVPQYRYTQGKGQLELQIDLGPRVLIRALELTISGEGKHDEHLNKLLETFPLQVQSPLLHDKYEQGKNQWLSQAIKSGYLDAHFCDHRIEVDLERLEAQIILHLDTGPLYRLGHVEFSEQRFAQSFLKRFVPFQLQDPYTPKKVLALQRNLLQSEYFNEVEVKPRPNTTLKQVPIDVSLVPKPANEYQLGAGFGTDTGLRGKMGWKRRHFNSKGHRGGIKVQGAQRYNEIKAQYQIPGKRPHTDEYRIFSSLTQEKYLDKNSRVHEIGFRETRDLRGWQRSFELKWINEKDDELFPLSPITRQYLLPSFQLSKTVQDSLSSPTYGYRFQTQISGAWDLLLSASSFAKFECHFKYLKQLGSKGTFVFHTDLGGILPDDVERLPLSVRFFAGGDESLRGFAYRSLPKEIDDEGEKSAIGGTYLALGGLEYQHHIKGPFRLAAFSDFGNAFNRKNNSVQLGIGLGIRYITPLGPIKIDLAKPLTSGAHSLRLHLSIGPEL